MANTLPSSTKTEDAVIASCLLFEENVDKAISKLSPNDFYDPKNQDVWQHIESLHSEGRPIELHTIEDKVGEDVYYDMTQTSADVEGDAEVIKQYSQLRTIIKTCNQASSQASDKKNPQDVLATLNSLFEQTSDSDITSLGDALTEALERNVKVADGEIDLGLKTGLDIDDRVGGYEDGKFYVIAARPSMGKSAYALHIMKALASQGVPVGMFSLEMTDMSLANRLLINAMDIDGMRIRNGDITDKEKDIMFSAASDIHDLPIFFDDNPSLTSGSFRARANTFKRTHGVGALIIDYLQIMEGGGSEESRHRELAEMARNCKKVAKDLDIPVIALSQLSRGVDNRNDKRPVKSDLRGSGGIEEAADCIQFLYRPEEYNQEYYGSSDPDKFTGSTKNICEIIVGKNREGRTGIEQQLFFASKMRFENLNYKHN